MNTKLTFNNSFIWPDNSKIKWEMEGVGKVNGKIKFIIRTNSSFCLENSCFISVMDDLDSQWGIEDSPIFWSAMEWAKIYKNDPLYAMKHDHYLTRQSAMQWAENYYTKIL